MVSDDDGSDFLVDIDVERNFQNFNLEEMVRSNYYTIEEFNGTDLLDGNVSTDLLEL